MEDNSRRLAKDRQLFAGAMGAGLSHEINNVLAIIGELSGLLQDLSMASDDKGVPPERLGNVLSRINTQVERGKVFVKLLNQFSHSPEVEEQSLNVADVLLHMFDLCGRLARLKKVTIATGAIDDTQVHGDLFNLQHILFRCIEIGLLTSETNATLNVTLADLPEGIVFSLHNEKPGNLSSEVQDKLTTATDISGRLGGKLTHSMENGALQIDLALPRQLAPLVGRR